jgi:hypothetical protein
MPDPLTLAIGLAFFLVLLLAVVVRGCSMEPWAAQVRHRRREAVLWADYCQRPPTGADPAMMAELRRGW